ncbi:MAG: HD domain-containing protein [Spirochaetes bacterium]|nr:HD domain-containing protein [Spirochaetota bacterium]
MNNYTINQVKENFSFSEDSFILDNLFFLPKNLPINDYHIELLSKWNISDIKTEGKISSILMDKLVVKDDNSKDPMKFFKEAEDSKLNDEIDKTINETEISPDLELIDKSILEENQTAYTNEDDKNKNIQILDSSVKSFIEIYKYWIKETVKIFKNFLLEKNVDKERVKNFVDDIIKISNKNRNNALLLFGKKFEGVLYVFPQTIETVILANIIADTRKLSPLATSNLALATFFHDFGMLKIPMSLLEKADKLTPTEMTVIQSHTTIGYKYLRDAKYSAIIASGALQHHERVDGKGYPSRLTPDRVTDIAKIISVVDAYCAAISSKPFKENPQHAKVVLQELLSKGGSVYDSSILRDLIKNISFYPIGSMVMLSDNNPAIVIGTSKAAMKPIIKVIAEGKEGEIIDLSERNDIFIKGVYKA